MNKLRIVDIFLDGNKTTRICGLGSCRLASMLDSLQEIGKGEVLWSASGFSHNSKQSLQLLRIIRGDQKVPEEHQDFVFGSRITEWGEENLTNGRAFLEDVDIFVIEISTNNNFSLENLQLNSDYLQSALIRPGGLPLLDWYQDVVRGGSDRSGIIKKVEDLEIEHSLFDKSQVLYLMENIDFQISKQSMIKDDLHFFQSETGKPMLIIPLFNIPGTVDVRRKTQTTFLHEFAIENKTYFFDPTVTINWHGRETALSNEGRDINHYEPSFFRILAADFHNYIQNYTSKLIDSTIVHNFTSEISGFMSATPIKSDGLRISSNFEKTLEDGDLGSITIEVLDSQINNSAGISLSLPNDDLDITYSIFRQSRIGWYRLNFFAMCNSNKPETKLKIYNGSRYITLNENLSKKWKEISVLTVFNPKNNFRIGLETPSEGEKITIKNLKFDFISDLSFSSEFCDIFEIGNKWLSISPIASSNGKSSDAFQVAGFLEDHNPSAGVSFSFSDELKNLQSDEIPVGNYKLSFKARKNPSPSEVNIRVFTGLQYVVLGRPLSNKESLYSLVEKFDFNRPSKFRISFLGPSTEDIIEISEVEISPVP